MLKLGFNEATCKENSSVERDLELCEKYGYDYIELNLSALAAMSEEEFAACRASL